MPLEYELLGDRPPTAVLWLTAGGAAPVAFEVSRAAAPPPSPPPPRLDGLLPLRPSTAAAAGPAGRPLLVIPDYQLPPGPGRCLLVRLGADGARAMGHGLPPSNDLLRLRRRWQEPLYAHPSDQGEAGRLGRVLASLRAGAGRLVPPAVLEDALARCAFLLARWSAEEVRRVRTYGPRSLVRYLDELTAQCGDGPPARTAAAWGPGYPGPPRSHYVCDRRLLRHLPTEPGRPGDADPSVPRELPAALLPALWAPTTFVLSLSPRWLAALVRNPASGGLVLMGGPLDPLWLEIFLHLADVDGGVAPWSRQQEVWRAWRG